MLTAELAPGDPSATGGFDIVGVEPGDGEVVLEVSGPGGETFVLRQPLSVRPTAPVETFSFVQSVPPGGLMQTPADLLAGFHAASASIVVGMNPLPDLDLPSILQGLARYPYGCAEQTTSTAAPLLYVGDVARSIGVRAGDDAMAGVAKGVERLLGMQTYSGGFGFWDSRYEAGHWITVYATDFLVAAKAAGADVPQAALGRALDRLGGIATESVRYGGNHAPGAYAFYVRGRASRIRRGCAAMPRRWRAAAIRT